MGTSSKTLTLAAASAALLLVLVAGCGSSKSSSSGTTTTAPTTTNTHKASQQNKGGTAQFNLSTDTDYTDPALAYYQVSWQFEYATCAKLLNYPDSPAPVGSKLIPEVAASLPAVSGDGKTYVFTIRPGYRFSPPSNANVTAQTFKFVFERNLNPRMQSPAVQFMGDIVGADDMVSGKATHLSGVTASGNKLTIRLVKPLPDLLARLAMPFFCALPTNTPINPNGVDHPAGAGPYYIADREPNRQIVLKRNPNYNGKRPHNLDQVVYTVGVPLEAGVLKIEKGEADYAADGLPPAVNSRLYQQYGPRSRPAQNGDQQYFVNPTLSINYIALNTSRPLFKSLKLRQAVNFAINRPALVAQRGANGGVATDQYLPPGLSAFKNADIYPLVNPNVEKAQQLAGSGSHGTAVLYTCTETPCANTAQILQQNLQQIGINVDIKQFATAVQYKKAGTKGEPFDMNWTGWLADYADPQDFINVLLYGPSIQQSNNVNTAYFDDPTFNKQMQQAAALSGSARDAAYAKLDADITANGAPLAAWGNSNVRDFFSARMGCQVYQPIYGMDIAGLCIHK